MTKRTLDACVRQMTKSWMGVKRARCEETGERHSLVPTLHLVFDGTPDRVVVCPAGVEDMPWAVTSTERDVGEPLAFVGVLGDCFGATVSWRDARPGEASRRFRAGDPDAYEALSVDVFDARLREWSGVRVRYEYDGVVPKFREVRGVPDRELTGCVRATIEETLRARDDASFSVLRDEERGR